MVDIDQSLFTRYSTEYVHKEHEKQSDQFPDFDVSKLQLFKSFCSLETEELQIIFATVKLSCFSFSVNFFATSYTTFDILLIVHPLSFHLLMDSFIYLFSLSVTANNPYTHKLVNTLPTSFDFQYIF